MLNQSDRIVKVLEDITGTPREIASQAREQIPPAISKYVGKGSAETIGMIVEYIILAGDLLLL